MTRLGLNVPFRDAPLSAQGAIYRRAEQLGFESLWAGETATSPDAFTALAAAIPVTSQVRLGTGIVGVFTRGPGVLAQTASAMQEASDGRFVLGLGASTETIVERFNGLQFQRPLAKVRDTVAALRPVLSVPADRGIGGLRLDRPVGKAVPIVLAALRERALTLAGSAADGVFTNLVPVSSIGRVLTTYDRALAASGRDAQAGERICRLFVFPGTDEQRVLQARMQLAKYASVPAYGAYFEWLGWGAQVEPIVTAYRSGEHEKAARLVPEELLREIFAFGSPSEIRARIAELSSGGFDTIVLSLAATCSELPSLLENLAPRV